MEVGLIIVIGVDPSLTRTGVAVVQGDVVLAWTAIKSEVDDSEKKMDDLARRVHELAGAFRAFVKPYVHERPVFCVEGQVAGSFGGKMMGPSTPFKIGVAYGAILASCTSPPLVINPSEVRRRLLGQRAVKKPQMRTYCKAHFGERHPPEPKTKMDREAVWDAVAVVLAMDPELERLRSFVEGGSK